MFKHPSHALLAALAVIAAPAFAQDTATPPAADEAAASVAEAEAAPEAAPEADQDVAAEATDPESTEPQVGQVYVKSTHGDWGLRCVRTENAADPCEMSQLLRDSGGTSVAEVTLIPLSNGEIVAGATFIAPLETDLIQGVGLAVDNSDARKYPFGVCTQVGCVARIGFSAAEVSQMKRGHQASVTLLPFGADPKEPVRLNMSLTGFTAAFDELAAQAQ